MYRDYFGEGMLIVVPSAAGWRTCIFSIVDINPCLVYHICLLWISSTSGKYLFVALVVNPGHVV